MLDTLGERVVVFVWGSNGKEGERGCIMMTGTMLTCVCARLITTLSRFVLQDEYEVS